MTKLQPGEQLVKPLTNLPLGDLMRQALYRLVAYLDAALRDAGYSDVGSPQVSVLATIDRDGSRLSTLVERGARTKQATAELVGQLLERGYVAVTPDPTDRRAKLYRPTASGEALLDVASRVVSGYEDWLDGMLGAERVGVLRDALATIVEDRQPPAR